ncbi:MAG: rhomboid family intramembrane serine protease [Candidatus Bathyarchaeia archaeon]
MSKTNLLILICLFTSALLWRAEPPLASILSFTTTKLLAGRVWILVTTLFIHADPIHLLGNMLFLYVFGNTLERLAGGGKMLTAFFIGGAATNILSIPFYPADVPLVGASAAIFTVAATVMLIKPLHFSWLFLLPVGLVAILYFLFNVFAVYRGLSGNVAYVSHIIGFLLGIPFGVAWSPTWVRSIVVTIGLLIVFILIATFVAPLVFHTIDMKPLGL